MSTSPISGDFTTCSQSVEAFFHPQTAANDRGFSSACPKTVCIIGLIGGWKNFVTCPQAFECERPMNPCPIKPTLTVGIKKPSIIKFRIIPFIKPSHYPDKRAGKVGSGRCTLRSRKRIPNPSSLIQYFQVWFMVVVWRKVLIHHGIGPQLREQSNRAFV
jgi:hypothetical protein